jgi:hypothetical protein
VIYLHIGRHKTGTSALQQLLRKNRKALAQHGFNYMPPARGGAGNPTLAAALTPGKMAAADPALRAVYEEELEVTGKRLRHRGHAIVSSEAFQHTPPASAAGFFPVGGTTVIVYLREQLDYMLSAYAQFVQAQPARMAFLNYAARINTRYDVFLRGWAEAFGRDAVIARPYVRERLKEGDVRHDFLSLIGADPAWLSFRPGLGNPSIGPGLIEAKGLINAFVPAETMLRLDLYTLLGQLAVERPERLRTGEAFGQAVRGRFTASNARLFEAWPELGPGFPMRELSPAPPNPQPYDALQELLTRLDGRAPQVAAELRGLLPDEATLRAAPALLPADWDAATAAFQARTRDQEA